MVSKENSFCYLDNAATSWPKPPAVVAAIQHFYGELGVAAERSGSSRAWTVERAIQKCRRQVKELLSSGTNDSVIFGFNGTDVLNLAIHGVVQAGDHVVTTVAEHNSTLRPLEYLREHLGISVSLAECDSQGLIDPSEIQSLMRPDTSLVCLSHVSNVTGVVQPVEEIGKICQDREVLYLVDAAQSLGHLPVDVKQIGCDFLTSSGHKGLLGPLGTGVLYIAEEANSSVRPLRQGGTGTQSQTSIQPVEMPYRLESGNLNTGGIMGLSAGLTHVLETGLTCIQRHEATLSEKLTQAMGDLKKIRLIGTEAKQRTGTVSFQLEGADPNQIASVLDSAFGFQVRAGLHCAPKMHESLGTLVDGGTVRISPGLFNTEQDIDDLISALREIATNMS
ncbi:MAG: aminotransferase class V-fold PLP-dependent enzyme [Mariniblastus sp.]|nr:aminotransferase class V-fold PLP-dependent enzyme [Mariniblastus sp.]